jgi:hypothetical protein
MVFFFFGIACIIVYMTIGPNHILSCVYAALGALLMCMVSSRSIFLAVLISIAVPGKRNMRE